MSNSYFRFKQFTIYQDQCAMKVGTDGTLLGAWVDVSMSGNVLDIGTGTGLVSLMIAQRAPQASVCAIDIDADAVRQAQSNVGMSQWEGRISVINSSLQNFTMGKYDTIVSNPPFFVDSLTCPDPKRSLARHAQNLTYQELIYGVMRLLTNDGSFSVIVPFDCFDALNNSAILAGLFLVRKCAVKSTPAKSVRRYLITYRRSPVELADCQCVCIEDGQHGQSEWYKKLTEDFYL